MDRNGRNGIVAAFASSALGGTASALTRCMIGAVDPVIRAMPTGPTPARDAVR
jgi:hypothetical protein